MNFIKLNTFAFLWLNQGVGQATCTQKSDDSMLSKID